MDFQYWSHWALFPHFAEFEKQIVENIQATLTFAKMSTFIFRWKLNDHVLLNWLLM